MTVELEVVTLADRSDLRDQVDEVTSGSWPEFMLHDSIADQYWYELYEVFPAYQFALLQPSSDRVVAAGNSVPLAWDGDAGKLPAEGWDWAMKKAFADAASGAAAKIQCALSITVSAPHLGKGLSPHMVEAMKQIGQSHGLESMIAPVRPNMKSQYPLTPMERYIEWRNEDGLPFDPWMRVHARLGAEIVNVCPRSMRIAGTVADWERWTEMRFPDDGEYVVPGALVPVTIDRDADQGVYVEPNVWLLHTIQ